MKLTFTSNGFRCSTFIIALIAFSSCRTMKNVSFSDALHKDTVSFGGSINVDSRIAGTRILGPYTISITGEITKASDRTGAVFINDANNRMAFTICKEGNCATADANYFVRTKKRNFSIISKGPTERILSNKISGSVNYLGDTPGFDVNITNGGRGVLNLTNGLVTIRPITKKSKYGKAAYGVGLEYVMNNEVIGSFIQQDDAISIVLKNNLSEKNKMILTAVSVCLMNKSDMIKIL